jgi:hypothetical protein
MLPLRPPVVKRSAETLAVALTLIRSALVVQPLPGALLGPPDVVVAGILDTGPEVAARGPSG